MLCVYLLNIPAMQMMLVRFRDAVNLDMLQTYAKDLNLRMVSKESAEFGYAIFLHTSVSVINFDPFKNKHTEI